MREILQKYYREIKELEIQCLEDGNKFKEEYKSTIYDMVDKITDNIISDLYKKINESYHPRNYEHKEKLLNYKVIWHVLDEYIYSLSTEFFNDENIGKWKLDAKTRLLMMFIKTFGEIIYLLEGGYSFCALSRIRYIYEIAVYIEIINKGTEETAKRFILFSEKSQMRLASLVGENQTSIKIKKRLKKRGYIDTYKNNYEWAMDVTQNPKITFKGMAYMTELKEDYIIYVFSCSSAHADVSGSLLSIDEPKKTILQNTWNTMPSKYGTTEIMLYLDKLIPSIVLSYCGSEGKLIKVVISMIISKFYHKKYRENSIKI